MEGLDGWNGRGKAPYKEKREEMEPMRCDSLVRDSKEEMDIQLPTRLVIVVLTWLALVLIASGAGGVTGYACAPLPLSHQARESSKLRGSSPTEALPKGYGVDCRREVEQKLTIVDAYLSIDTLFGNVPFVDVAGSLSFRRLRRVKPGMTPLVVWRRTLVGRDNIVFAKSMGIKLAFLFCVVAFFISVLLALSSRGLIWFYTPTLLYVERVYLIVGAVLNVSGGITAAVWGSFAHLGPDERGDVIRLTCFGWILGGVLMVLAGLGQTVDVTLTFVFKPKLRAPVACHVNSKGSPGSATGRDLDDKEDLGLDKPLGTVDESARPADEAPKSRRWGSVRYAATMDPWRSQAAPPEDGGDDPDDEPSLAKSVFRLKKMRTGGTGATARRKKEMLDRGGYGSQQAPAHSGENSARDAAPVTLRTILQQIGTNGDMDKDLDKKLKGAIAQGENSRGPFFAGQEDAAALPSLKTAPPAKAGTKGTTDSTVSKV